MWDTPPETIIPLESSKAQGTSVTRVRWKTSCPPMTKRRLLEPRAQAGEQIQRVWQKLGTLAAVAVVAVTTPEDQNRLRRVKIAGR